MNFLLQSFWIQDMVLNNSHPYHRPTFMTPSRAFHTSSQISNDFTFLVKPRCCSFFCNLMWIGTLCMMSQWTFYTHKLHMLITLNLKRNHPISCFFLGFRPHIFTTSIFPTFWTSKLEHYINLCVIKLIIFLINQWKL
jgi:hypothetical protein